MQPRPATRAKSHSFIPRRTPPVTGRHSTQARCTVLEGAALVSVRVGRRRGVRDEMPNRGPSRKAAHDYVIDISGASDQPHRPRNLRLTPKLRSRAKHLVAADFRSSPPIAIPGRAARIRAATSRGRFCAELASRKRIALMSISGAADSTGSADASFPFALPPLGGNPSSVRAGTTPGSFAASGKIAQGAKGRYTFSSPDTPGMPEPSTKTAWDFMPANWSLRPGCERDYESSAAWIPPVGFHPVTQLEHARLGTVTPEMRRVAEREPHLTRRASPRRSRRWTAHHPGQPGALRLSIGSRWQLAGPREPK